MDDKIHILHHKPRCKPNTQLCNDRQPTKQIEKLQLPKIPVICDCWRKKPTCDNSCRADMLLVLLFSMLSFTCFSQEPTPYLETQDTCTTYYDFTSEWAPADYILNEEWVSVGGIDTFTGFWALQRFFVPDRGIMLSFSDCGVAFDYVPSLTEPILYDSKIDMFLPTKSQTVATWSRVLGYGLMALGGYLGSEGERQRVINGLDSKAFHVNRDLSLACAFSAGTSFTLSWSKTPKLKWYEPLLDAALGGITWYAVAQRNWESYK